MRYYLPDFSEDMDESSVDGPIDWERLDNELKQQTQDDTNEDP